MKKALYLLTCIDCYDSHIVSVDAYPTKEEAQAAMKESYEAEFNDMVESGWDEEDIDRCSECLDEEAYVGLNLADNSYRWEINRIEVEL